MCLITGCLLVRALISVLLLFVSREHRAQCVVAVAYSLSLTGLDLICSLLSLVCVCFVTAFFSCLLSHHHLFGVAIVSNLYNVHHLYNHDTCVSFRVWCVKS